MEHLQSFITDCDRRTESAKKRLAETQEELSAEVAAKANKVHDLAEQIGKKLARAESLGADGMVEVSAGTKVICFQFLQGLCISFVRAHSCSSLDWSESEDIHLSSSALTVFILLPWPVLQK